MIRKHLRRSSLLLLEALVALMAIAVVGIGLTWWRLAAGPMELPWLQRHVQAELAAARGGRPVAIDRVELAWSAQNRALEVRALGVKALDGQGQPLSTSKEVAIGLNVAGLLLGRVELERARFRGGDLTITHRDKQGVFIAFGPPGAPADIIIPPPPPNETLLQRVNRVLDLLAAAFKPVGPGGKLKDLRIEDLRLVIQDEALGLEWRAQGADLHLVREADALRLNIGGKLQGAKGLAPVKLAVVTDVALKTAAIDVRLDEVRPAVIAPAERLGALAALDAPLSAVVSVALDRAKGVTRLDGDVTAGPGRIVFADGATALDGGRVRGNYDIEDDVLAIEEIGLAGARTRVVGEGRLERFSTLIAGGDGKTAPFVLDFPKIEVEMPGVLAGPVAINNVSGRGALDGAARRLNLESLALTVDGATATLAGQVYLGKDKAGVLRPGFKLTGAAEGPVSPRTVMKLWPLNRSKNTRTYLDQAMLGGALSQVRFESDVTPDHLASLAADGPLEDQALSVSFAFNQANVDYIVGMAPLAEGQGQAVLRGNSFELVLDRAVSRAGEGRGQGQPLSSALTVTRGKVSIPKFKPRGAMAVYEGFAEGEARAMVDLLLQAPLDLGPKLPFQIDSLAGRGAASFRIERPLKDVVAPEEHLYAVSGDFTGVGGRTKDGKATVRDWKLRLAGDHRALTLKGPLKVGGSDVDLDWTETLDPKEPAPSRVVMNGRMRTDDLADLGYPIDLIADGVVNVAVRSSGKGLTLARARGEVDLTPAEAFLPQSVWTKAAGVPARLEFDAQRAPDGLIALTRIAARGNGLAFDGAARVTDQGDIVSASVSRMDIEGRLNATAEAERTPQGALKIEARGGLMNLGAVASGKTRPRTPRPGEKPFPALIVHLTSDQMEFQGGAVMRRGDLNFTTDGVSLTSLALKGIDPGGKPMTFSITPQAGTNTAKVAFRAEDAGFAWKAVTGQPNIRGGVATAQGDWVIGTPSSAKVKLVMNDFQMVNVPVMARLLSSVGSLQGLAEMLGSDGISFNTLEAPLTFAQGRLSLEECRLAGPSIGLTAKGKVDLETGVMAIDGVLVPSYGLNSMISNVPVLGELLASRKGEGVVGLTYTIKGQAEDAKVGVNPLSALTPGIFRRIFEPITPRTPAAAPAKPGGVPAAAPLAPPAPALEQALPPG
jgi:hypothetical protein